MAYDKIITLRRRMDNCINYVLNEEKTSLSYALTYVGDPAKTHRLVTGINCQVETAYEEMRVTKRRWDKRGGVLGYHIIHSYAPGEVTPEEAHDAGVEFARRLLGDRYEAVVSTHLDREHLHCHIVFNSVSFMDGKKYRSDFKSYFGDLRDTSNAVSRDYGLSVIEPDGHGKHYAEWDMERRGKATLSALVRQDIDAALTESFTYDSLLAALRRCGYTVKQGAGVKHTALRPEGGKRFFRLDSLGPGYTEADLRTRLAAVRSGKPATLSVQPRLITPHRYTVNRGMIPTGHPRKLRGFRALYVYYLYLLGVRSRTPRRRQPPFSVRKEVTRLQRYQRQFLLLQEYRIDSDSQLSMLADALQARIDALVDRRKKLYQQKRNGEDVALETEDINQELRQLRQRLKTCGQIAVDIPRIRAQVKQSRDSQHREEEHHQRKTYAPTEQDRPDRRSGPVR